MKYAKTITERQGWPGYSADEKKQRYALPLFSNVA
jgi:hypothetical protein